jgi:hypothetical protein
MSETVHGSCLCGGIEFDVHEPEALVVCHCSRCQRWSGGPGVTVVVVAAKNFEVAKGRDLVKRYEAGEGHADRHFCSHCGSGLYGAAGEKYYVGAGVLHDVKLRPACHVQVARKATWDEIGGNAPQFPEWPPTWPPTG